MNSNAIDIKTKTAKSNAFPSARYFQIHFDYIHELIANLQSQLELSNQKITALQQQLNDAKSSASDNIKFYN